MVHPNQPSLWLYSAIEYMRPGDYYMGNPEEIKRQRDEELVIARARRLAAKFDRMLKLGQSTSCLKPSFVPFEGSKA